MRRSAVLAVCSTLALLLALPAVRVRLEHLVAVALP